MQGCMRTQGRPGGAYLRALDAVQQVLELLFRTLHTDAATSLGLCEHHLVSLDTAGARTLSTAFGLCRLCLACFSASRLIAAFRELGAVLWALIEFVQLDEPV